MCVLQWGMMRQLEAVYENGVLRPLEPLDFAEQQRVRITVSDQQPGPRIDDDVVQRACAEIAAAGQIPSIEEVRAIMAKIPGSMSDDIIRDRGDY
jgi:predicted DNA-binding antitoxin AbrB/MazE fold protein